MQRVHDLNPELIPLFIITHFEPYDYIVRVNVAMVLPLLIQTHETLEGLEQERPDVGFV